MSRTPIMPDEPVDHSRARLDPDTGMFPLRGLLGMHIESPAPGRGIGGLDVEPVHLNPNGVVHGAVLFALVDTAMGAATMSVLQPGEICASIDVHLRFVRPVSEGRLEVVTAVVHQGRRVVQLQGEIRSGDRLVATATGAFAVLAPR